VPEEKKTAHGAKRESSPYRRLALLLQAEVYGNLPGRPVENEIISMRFA
jgi:hypothetical protein